MSKIKVLTIENHSWQLISFNASESLNNNKVNRLDPSSNIFILKDDHRVCLIDSSSSERILIDQINGNNNLAIFLDKS